MNLLQTLLKTYERAEDAGIVDMMEDEMMPPILPLYHSYQRSSSGQDILEITLTEDGRFLRGRFLKKGEYSVFPISNQSIKRSGSTVAPHFLCDNFSYLGAADQEKHEAYLKGLERLQSFFSVKRNATFSSIYHYMHTGDLQQDILTFLKRSSDENTLSVDDDDDEVTWKENGKNRTIYLSKIFITFAVMTEGIPLSVSRDRNLHQVFIQYIEGLGKKEKQEYCDVTGREMFCVSQHRGVIGNAKLVAVSNHTEAYMGRLQSGEEVYHIGYETSQKIHNMLKFLLDAQAYSRYLGGNAYVVSWLIGDLSYGGAPLTSFSQDEEDEYDDYEIADEGDSATVLGALRSDDITAYFEGIRDLNTNEEDKHFCVLILEKVNSGRIAVKYFHTFLHSDIEERVKKWFISMGWPCWSKEKNGTVVKAPSPYSVVSYLYGEDTDKGLTLSGSQDKLRRSGLERLLTCVLEGKRLPADMMELAFHRLMNNQSFKHHWRHALQIGCTLIKKYHYDRGRMILMEKGVIMNMESRSFAYGRLLAVYDKLEADVLYVKAEKDSHGEVKIRATTASRLWSAMIHRPLKIANELEIRTKVYQQILKKNNPGLAVRYSQMRTEIYNIIATFEKEESQRNMPANEEFVLGYYYQQQEIYRKKSNE